VGATWHTRKPDRRVTGRALDGIWTVPFGWTPFLLDVPTAMMCCVILGFDLPDSQSLPKGQIVQVKKSNRVIEVLGIFIPQHITNIPCHAMA
jgi:hypothetical protein